MEAEQEPIEVVLVITRTIGTANNRMVSLDQDGKAEHDSWHATSRRMSSACEPNRVSDQVKQHG